MELKEEGPKISLCKDTDHKPGISTESGIMGRKNNKLALAPTDEKFVRSPDTWKKNSFMERTLISAYCRKLYCVWFQSLWKRCCPCADPHRGQDISFPAKATHQATDPRESVSFRLGWALLAQWFQSRHINRNLQLTCRPFRCSTNDREGMTDEVLETSLLSLRHDRDSFRRKGCDTQRNKSTI